MSDGIKLGVSEGTSDGASEGMLEVLGGGLLDDFDELLLVEPLELAEPLAPLELPDPFELLDSSKRRRYIPPFAVNFLLTSRSAVASTPPQTDKIRDTNNGMINTETFIFLSQF